MNIKAAKELLNTYKSITLKQLEEKFDELRKCFLRPNICGDDVMIRITGFGSTEYCVLCREAKKLAHYCYCDHCIYKLNSELDDDSFYCLGPTYDAICKAETAENLYKAIWNRIKYLEETIEIYGNK